ncbi:TPA: hypothetical protein L4E43_003530 [Pseudomonas aeruginosa]|uniref:hypothetical protein n=1 Tax=Pseudomonas aeruginosa TaxID=287 RepID=UPI000F87C372|nr:hypothetical protein [Pseudomonas aeruginosa]MCT5234073.1 hypothetical protein [Pseudomonas aeruginosa]MDI4100812.1 hypothetical protein [Pseudomonas aeruginosa]QPZ57171.1 hypothetical protein I9X26_19870 [Pseudomonas aeruginosa]QPZ58003.1 hypothetical protein I9X26_24235 [Pseudomonas aeruginosa]RUJ61444.1 hypothetical protein IPC331_07695 [Pseudomonas aeruginosa]
MSEVKRFDHVNHAHVDDCAHIENPGGAWVKASDYDALAAEAQALREEVARGNRITLAMALDIAAVGVALGIPGEQQEGGTGEFIEAIQNLQKELEALRARVVVVPERKLLNAGVPGLNRNSGWNACLDELARLNGKTVSEGLLREVARHLGNWLELHECECDGGFHYCGRDQVAKTNRELRALLNQDKENGNG